MGLCVTAKGLDSESIYNCGNITYVNFIIELIKVAYDEKCADIFHDSIVKRRHFTKEEEEYWNSHCNDDLDIFIWHSDCEGKITFTECRKIYKVIKDLEMEMIGHNYGVMKPYNMLEHWKAIFKHCAKRRVNLYFY